MIAYRLPEPLPWAVLAGPVAAAEAALARLDERLATSPIRAGWIARNEFAAACAEAALAGELVHLEDLVLHEAGMDIRMPTADLTRAHASLRLRRRLAACRAAEAWDLAEREAFGPPAAAAAAAASPAGEGGVPSSAATDRADEKVAGTELAAALAAVDAALARVDRTLAGDAPSRPARAALIYDADWGQGRRRDSWEQLVTSTRDLPAVLAAAIVADAWQALEPVQYRDRLGWALAGALLRTRGTTTILVGLATGLRSLSRLRWQSPDPVTRLLALLEGLVGAAEAGRKDHERWFGARQRLLGTLAGRRSSSHLPALVDYVLRTPLVSAGMIAQELGITPRAAQTLVAELGLREWTGRTRYRAWGVL